MVNIAVCDTNKAHLEYIMNLVGKYCGEKAANICGFAEPIDFMEYLQFKGDKVDIVICDIKLKEYDGIKIVYKAQELLPDLVVIFVSARTTSVFDAYHVRHRYFVPKPIELRRFKEAMEYALADVVNNDARYLVFSSKGVVSKLNIKSIYYIESDLRKIIVHTANTSVESYGKLDLLLPMLDRSFLHCHKSYIVNMDYVEKLDDKEFLLSNGIAVKISPRRYKESKEGFIRYITNSFDDSLYTDITSVEDIIKRKVND